MMSYEFKQSNHHFGMAFLTSMNKYYEWQDSYIPAAWLKLFREFESKYPSSSLVHSQYFFKSLQSFLFQSEFQEEHEHEGHLFSGLVLKKFWNGGFED